MRYNRVSYNKLFARRLGHWKHHISLLGSCLHEIKLIHHENYILEAPQTKKTQIWADGLSELRSSFGGNPGYCLSPNLTHWEVAGGLQIDCGHNKTRFSDYLVIHFHKNTLPGGTPTTNHIDFVSPDEIEVLDQFRGFHVDYFAEGPSSMKI